MRRLLCRWRYFTPFLSSVQRPEHLDSPDIMHNRVQSPLHIHLAFRPQGEAAHPFVNANVRKHRLDNPQPPGVDFPVRGAVYFGFHLVQHVRLWLIHLHREIAA